MNDYTKVPYQEQPETDRNQKIKDYYATGDYSYNKLSRIFKISPQRVHQIVKAGREK